MSKFFAHCGLAAGVLLLSVAAQAGEVNVYSARHYDADRQLYDAFTAQTGIEVRVLEGSSDQLVERIRREGIASPADVLMTVDAGRLWRAEQAGIFQPVDSEILQQRIPAHLRHPQGLWFGFSQRLRLIYYNAEKVNPDQVATYEALADPALRGKICIRSSNNIYNQSLLAAMVEIHGAERAEQWARDLVANLARPPQGGDTDQIRGVAAGECDIAVANHYYYLRLLDSEDPAERAVARAVSVMLPGQDDRGVHVNIGGAGVARHAPNRENAVRFLEFLASDEAQRIFTGANYEYPVVEGVDIHQSLEQWGRVRLDTLTIEALGRSNPEAVRIADRVRWR